MTRLDIREKQPDIKLHPLKWNKYNGVVFLLTNIPAHATIKIGGGFMLSQKEADSLIEELKEIRELNGPMPFPQPGSYQKLDLVSSDGEHSYIVDIQRKGYINYIKKCTYQSRFRKDVILLRLDVEGPEHTNPSGEKLPSTHLHVYREGLDDKFAIPAPPEFSNTDDLIQTMIDFLVYFKTTNTDSLEIETVM